MVGEFRDKFVAFVDILGFKEMVKGAETGTGRPLSALLALQKKLGTRESRDRYVKRGPTVCPHSTFIQRHLDFQLTQVSDCVVVSCEVSPAGAINLIQHCSHAVIELLADGVMCRGYITRGLVYHVGDTLLGSGYQEAHSREGQVAAFKRTADERGTPFVEIDRAVCDYIDGSGDKCVRELFSRMVKSDGNVTALFPFQGLDHSFIIAGFGVQFDPEKEKKFVQSLREIIQMIRERVLSLVDSGNSSAVRKAEHYIAALDAQLAACNRTEEIIDRLVTPHPGKRTPGKDR